MKRLFAAGLALFLVSALHAVSYDSGGGTGINSTDNITYNGATINGNTTLGDASGDSVTVNAATLSFANDTAVTLTGGVNGLNFGSNTLSIDAANLRVGIGTNAPTVSFHVAGDVSLASMTVIDTFNPSFGTVTAASTSTLTWSEVTDRLSEFVTSSFTVTIAGFYQVNVSANASQTAGRGCLLIKKNAVSIGGGESCATGATALLTVLPIAEERILNLSVNDIIRVDASATTANTTFTDLTLVIRRVP